MIAPAKTRVTTPFGWVKGYPLNKGSYPGFGNAPGPDYGFHTGVDYSWSPDNQIYMPEDGVVQLFAWDGKSYDGNAIVVAVGNRRHFMGHIRKNGFLVDNGQFVKEGTPIAIMGDTGYAIGVHLHYGVRVNGLLVDGQKLSEGNMSSSQTQADETTIKLEYNNGLLRDAQPNEVQGLLGQTVEAVQRTIGGSPEHSDIIGKVQLGAQVRKLLGNDVSPQNMEQKMKDKYGDGGNCTPEERAYLDATYKVVVKKVG